MFRDWIEFKSLSDISVIWQDTRYTKETLSNTRDIWYTFCKLSLFRFMTLWLTGLWNYDSTPSIVKTVYPSYYIGLVWKWWFFFAIVSCKQFDSDLVIIRRHIFILSLQYLLNSLNLKKCYPSTNGRAGKLQIST